MCILSSCLLAGCGSGAEDDRTTVVAAFYPIAYAAQRVAGDGIDVRNLTPAGAEPHDRELSARDVQQVEEAEHILYLGEGFMPALEAAVADHPGALDLLQGQRLAETKGGPDPHVWLDPNRYARMVERVGSALDRIAAARRLVHELDRLDGEFHRGLAGCRRRTVVTSHAAFGYLARRYHLEQIALTGVSPEAEPSPRALETLVAEVERRSATTVFFETLVSPRLAETVAREAGAATAVLDPLESLTKDEIEKGADYFSVMRENLAALRKALECR
jgi:zinc transport system substrate-binding protein